MIWDRNASAVAFSSKLDAFPCTLDISITMLMVQLSKREGCFVRAKALCICNPRKQFYITTYKH